MSREMRRQPRRAVTGRCDVVDSMTDETVGHVGNLSIGGMLLIANRSLPDDALFQFRFPLPSDAGSAQPVEVGVHVLWQSPGGAPGQHWTGLRFLGLSADVTHRLRVWTQHPDAQL